MKKMIAVLMLLTASGVSVAVEDKPLDEFAKTVAAAVFRNDLAAVTNTYLPPSSAWQAEMTKSWNKTRATAESRGITWRNCTVTAVRVQKLETHGKIRVADVLVDCTDGALTFTLFLDECQEVNGKWFLLLVKWREPKLDEGTTPPAAR